MSIQRRRILYSGHVQGVGFRYTTLRISQKIDVRGYVRNLPDGSVEILVEGKPATLDLFLSAISTEMGTKIRNTSLEIEPVSEPMLGEFSIRH